MEIKDYQKRTWVEIDLNAIKNNYEIIKSKLNDNVKICCVIKANAYGHGAVQISKFIEKQYGDSFFAVSNIEEALQLRKNNIKSPILILGYTCPKCVKELIKYDISQTVFSEEYLNMIFDEIDDGERLKIHLKIDTGMSRIGFRFNSFTNEIEKSVNILKSKKFILEGIFTHFSSADQGEDGLEFTNKQFADFNKSINYLKDNGIEFSIKHCSNSAAIFDYANMNLDMVRAGIVLYGLAPSDNVRNCEFLKPALEMKSIISEIKEINTGDAVSYGRTFIADKPIKIATLPVGYADGLWRSNQNNNSGVIVKNKFCKFVGRICMDQCMVNVSNIDEVKVGDEVTIYSRYGKCSIDEIAQNNNTINYEVLCSIANRVTRVYKINDRIVFIKDDILGGYK